MYSEETIFTDALAMPDAQERRDFLDKSCGLDAGLRAQIEVLLAAHDRAGSFLDAPLAGLALPHAGAASAAPVEQPGAMVGACKLLRLSPDRDCLPAATTNE